MAHLFETRNIQVDPSGIDKLCRVACIGDSMMYGQGVLPRHALPPQLAKTLNAAFPHHMVWCDNLGESSGNIWNAWTQFKLFAATTPVDAVVFSICQNDSQIFDSNTIRYHSSEKLQYWLDGTPYRMIVEDTLADIRNFCDAKGIFPVLLFYTFVEKDEPIIKIVREICERLGIGLVDMLSFFKQESGVSIREYCASPFDGHPSLLGHESCARHIARLMLQNQAFAADREVDGKELAPALAATAGQMMENGSPGPTVALWARDAIDAKETRFRRLRGKGEKPGFGDGKAARDAVGHSYNQWFRSEISRAADTLIAAEMRNAQRDVLPRLHATLRNLEEMLFCVEHGRGGDMMRGLSNLLDSSDFFKGAGRLQPISETWHEVFGNQTAKLQAIADAAGSRLETVNAGRPAEIYLKTFVELTHALVAISKRMPVILERNAASIADPEHRTFWQVFDYCSRGAFSIANALWTAIAKVTDTEPASPLLFTRVSVLVEGGKVDGQPGGACNLIVEGDYQSPASMRYRDKLWAGVEYDRYLHVFEMPLMLSGDLRVGVPDWDPLRPRLVNGSTRIVKVEIRQISMDTPPEEAPILAAWEGGPGDFRAMIEFPGLKLY